jgi:hypothetical protein
MNALRKLANICRVPQKGTAKVQLSLRITPLEMAALQREAERFGLTVTEVIRSWIRTLQSYEPHPPKPPQESQIRPPKREHRR